ncbi:MAG TPA: PH domain-containing protein [Candidatus Thermoplasmatota archaeon]
MIASPVPSYAAAPSPSWVLRPAPAGAVNWGLRYASQFFVFALFLGWTGAANAVDWRVAAVGALAAPLAAGMVAGILYRQSFEAELSPLGLTVRRGVLTKRADFVAYARMQSVVVKQGPLQRIFGIGDVLVQSAKQGPMGGGEQQERRNRSVDASLELRFEGIIRNVADFEHVRGFLIERAEQARVAPVAGPPTPAGPPSPAGSPAKARMPADVPGLFAEAAAALHRALSGSDVPPPPVRGPTAVPLQPRARVLWTTRWTAGLLVLYIPFALAFPWQTLALTPLAPLAAYGAARVYYRHYRVTVQSEAIEVERGLLTLRRALVPFRRIQNVNVIAGPLERALGLKTLRIEAAGPNIAEGYIDGIRSADAEPLVAFLMGRAERARFDDALGDQAAARDARAQAVDEMRAINALLEHRAAAAAGRDSALGGGRWLPGAEVLSRKWPVANGFSSALGGAVLWLLTVSWVLAALRVADPLLWAGTALAFIGAFGAAGWGYARVRLRLFAFRFGPETLEVRHGVLFRAHDLIPYRRIQSVGVSSGPVERRLFGIWSLRLSTAGTSSGLTEFPGVVDPRPYADFLLAKARLSAAPSGESPVVELAAETQRAAQLVLAIEAARRRAAAPA